jgi:uncharacterized protein YbgA (DUF1722 family)/uncharacterized protein YbbK (DUF523 family)
MDEKIKIGISSCLFGNAVRYDGSSSRDSFLMDTLGHYVSYVPVCPEVECGLSIPREPVRLVGSPDAPRLVTTRTGIDHTERMLSWAHKRVAELEDENLCGFIFKKNSPSSGMERVKVYVDYSGMPVKKGVGMFARAFMEHFPLLPVEEDGRLCDIHLRDNFVERIFALKRWRDMLDDGKNRGSLVAFHTAHKLLIMSHSTTHYHLMGKLVARAKELSLKELYTQYESLLLDALRLMAKRKKHVNVLQHMMGYFKKTLSADEKKELLEVIDNYAREYVPLIVPVTLINHYVRKYDQPYLKGQVYLNPHPLELQIRNHV